MFKHGDKVRYVSDTPNYMGGRPTYLTLGKVYIVDYIQESASGDRLKLLAMGRKSPYSWRFELVKPSNKERMEKRRAELCHQNST